MPEKRTINVKQFVNDLRSGLSDVELMEKHRLSARGLQRAFEKLIACGAIAEDELERRKQPYDDTCFFQDMRVLARHHLIVPIPIYEKGQYPKIAGRIHDITDHGLGISGMAMRLSEIKEFCIYPDTFVHCKPFTFRAQCRWIERLAPGEFMGGFEIIDISPGGLQSIREMIQELTFG